MSHKSECCSQFAVSDSLQQMIETVSRLMVVKVAYGDCLCLPRLKPRLDWILITTNEDR